MSIQSVLGNVTDALKAIVNLGLGLAVVFLVVDLLQPGTTNIVANVSGLVSSFTENGVVGLITLIVFVSIFLGDD
jgi:formate-dependent nitrite reductase membrane component NrfD